MRKLRQEEILRRYAFYLFTRLQFEKSLKYYLQIREGQWIKCTAYITDRTNAIIWYTDYSVHVCNAVQYSM